MSNKSDEVLRTTLGCSDLDVSYDPAKIVWSTQFILLEAIYSTLILDQTGVYAPGLAKSWCWNGSVITFELRSDLTTIDGYHINAHDVEFSIKRLIYLNSGTHSNFKRLLCPNGLREISEKCSSIQVNSRHSISFCFEERSEAYLYLFSSLDAAILPQKSVNPITLQIDCYRNTSGPYYIDQISSAKDFMTLKVNPKHWLLESNTKCPKKIEIFSKEFSRIDGFSVEAYLSGKVNHLSTVSVLNKPNLDKILEECDNVVHETEPMDFWGLKYSKLGRELSVENRLWILKTVHEALDNFTGSLGRLSKLYQFIPKGGYGYVEGSVADFFPKNITPVPPSGKIVVSVFNKDKSMIAQILKNASVFEFIEKGKVKNPDDADFDKRNPHLSSIVFDTSFYKETPSIIYNVKYGNFVPAYESGDDWLSRFEKSEDSGESQLMMQEICLDSVFRDPCVIPFFSSRYVSVARGWKMNFSTSIPNNRFWEMEKA